MFKKCLAALLAVCLILLSFGCGQKPGGESTETTLKSAAEDGQKVAIIVGEKSVDPETFSAASEIARAYDSSLMLLTFGAEYAADPDAIKTLAEKVAGDDSVQAILFANGVKGTGTAVQRVREMRSDICIAVCNPHEGSVNMHGADLVLSVDFPALGEAMVNKAKDMGAENFVFYTTNRHMKYSSVVALRSAAEDACKQQKMTFKLASSVDLLENGRDLETAKLYIAEDAARKNEKFGQKTALVSTEPQVQGAVAAEAVRYGMVMPATFLPSPLLLAADLGVDMTGHETDSAYALEQIRAGESGAAGHVATWGFSANTAFLQAVLDWTSRVVGGGGRAVTTDEMQELLIPYTFGADVTVTKDANGAFLVQSELVTL